MNSFKNEDAFSTHLMKKNLKGHIKRNLQYIQKRSPARRTSKSKERLKHNESSVSNISKVIPEIEEASTTRED